MQQTSCRWAAFFPDKLFPSESEWSDQEKAENTLKLKHTYTSQMRASKRKYALKLKSYNGMCLSCVRTCSQFSMDKLDSSTDLFYISFRFIYSAVSIFGMFGAIF